jgi:uncharacterized protein YidB (DUF937 family)
MGLFDSIVGAVAGGAGQGGGGADLVGALLQQVGGGQGLQGLVQQFSQGGLGEVVQSWVSTGQNLPISGDQIAQVLGNGQLAQLAQQFGLNPDTVANQLAQFLPQVVDQLTPNGQLPSGGAADLMGMLGGLLKR